MGNPGRGRASRLQVDSPVWLTKWATQRGAERWVRVGQHRGLQTLWGVSFILSVMGSHQRVRAGE